jgi:hypothetical protein
MSRLVTDPAATPAEGYVAPSSFLRILRGVEEGVVVDVPWAVVPLDDRSTTFLDSVDPDDWPASEDFVVAAVPPRISREPASPPGLLIRIWLPPIVSLVRPELGPGRGAIDLSPVRVIRLTDFNSSEPRATLDTSWAAS